MCDRDIPDVVVSGRAWCDPCLAPIVHALNERAVPTVASCCGHGERLGSIALKDGRQLVVVPGMDTLNRLSALPMLIAGADAPLRDRGRTDA